jgi:hypothetical protein
MIASLLIAIRLYVKRTNLLDVSGKLNLKPWL